MEYPMRKYGRNIYENLLSLLLNIASFTSFIFTVLLLCFFHKLIGIHHSSGVALAGGLLISALLTGLASAGIRQNMAIIAPACVCFTMTAFFSIFLSVHFHKIYFAAGGIVLLILLLLIIVCKNQAMLKRFKPRFFSLRQFQTMIQVADAMLDADGKQVLHPIEISINTDHLLSQIESPAATNELKTVLILTEWVLPVLLFRPFPFSSLGSDERRRVIEKVVGSKGIFRNVAKALKLLFCIGYYGDEKGMRQTGYIPFEEREKAHQDQTPFIYQDPFLDKTN